MDSLKNDVTVGRGRELPKMVTKKMIKVGTRDPLSSVSPFPCSNEYLKLTNGFAFNSLLLIFCPVKAEGHDVTANRPGL